MENTRDGNDGSSDYSGQLFESFFTADEYRNDIIDAHCEECCNTIFATSVSGCTFLKPQGLHACQKSYLW